MPPNLGNAGLLGRMLDERAPPSPSGKRLSLSLAHVLCLVPSLEHTFWLCLASSFMCVCVLVFVFLGGRLLF